MRITSISNNYQTRSNNNVAKQNPTFKGLWGKSVNNYYSDSCYESDDTILYYYPFKDESKKEIDEVVKENTSSWESPASDKPKWVYEPLSQSSSTTVQVCNKLPFTKAEFEKYRSNPNSSLKSSIIERYIMEKDLELYSH